MDYKNPDGSEPSAFEKAAQAGNDPRIVPQRPRSMPEGENIPYPQYSEEEHETWRILYRRQLELLPERACDEFLEGLAIMHFPKDRIPALADVHRVLQETTNWGVARAPGLLHEEVFFEALSRRVFPCTDYIRPREELDYTPAPDLFHDIFGHTPMITHPQFADFYQDIGKAANNARGVVRRQLERIYWFTVEFGLIKSPHGLRIYGNGILSSYKEVQHSLTDAVEKRAFDPDVVAEQEYDVWHLQPLLFVIESFDQLQDQFYQWARKKGLLS